MDEKQIEKGWMKGFPPPEDKVISIDRGNYNSWPQIKWTFSNAQQLRPTKSIWRGPGAAQQLELNDAGFDRLTIESQDGRSLPGKSPWKQPIPMVLP
jgi:hypothetical protein